MSKQCDACDTAEDCRRRQAELPFAHAEYAPNQDALSTRRRAVPAPHLSRMGGGERGSSFDRGGGGNGAGGGSGGFDSGDGGGDYGGGVRDGERLILSSHLEAVRRRAPQAVAWDLGRHVPRFDDSDGGTNDLGSHGKTYGEDRAEVTRARPGRCGAPRASGAVSMAAASDRWTSHAADAVAGGAGGGGSRDVAPRDGQVLYLSPRDAGLQRRVKGGSFGGAKPR
ncbi:unnamed protein product [Phaeothamnion confervicola]